MDPFIELLGESPAIEAARDSIRRLLSRPFSARRPPAILLEGETGSGKGLVASVLHRAGPRAPRAFVPSTARRFRRRCSSRSCSATSAARSPTRARPSPGSSRPRTRHDLPGRGRAPAGAAPGEAADRHRGARGPAPGRHAPRAGRRVDHQRHQRGSADRHPRPPLPRGSLPPARRPHAPPAPAARARARRDPPRRAPAGRASAPTTACRSRPCRRRPRSGCWRTRGPATCASSATCWSGSRC